MQHQSEDFQSLELSSQAMSSHAPADNAQSFSWKSKLSDDQLKKKRITDRRSRREARTKAKDTISVLEDRLRLMATPDRLVMSLLESNAELQAQRDKLQGVLDGCFTAFGLDKHEGRDILTRVMRKGRCITDEARPAGTSAVVAGTRSGAGLISSLPSPGFSSDDEASLSHRSPVDVEIDSRMRGHILPSPFPRIGASMRMESQCMMFSDDQLLSAIPIWRDLLKNGSSDGSTSIFDLSCRLIHSDLPPSQLRDAGTLDKLVRHPDFFHIMVAELLSCPLEQVRPPGESHHPLLDSISRKRRQMIALAVESTRSWKYHSPVERIVMFWAVYRFLCILVFPTRQNLARCPTWYRPIPSQFMHPHPTWVDLIPWPLMRDRLVHTYHDYADTELMSSMLSNLQLNPTRVRDPRSLLVINEDRSDLTLAPDFQAELTSSTILKIKPRFLQTFPEFSLFLDLVPLPDTDHVGAAAGYPSAQQPFNETTSRPDRSQSIAASAPWLDASISMAAFPAVSPLKDPTSPRLTHNGAPEVFLEDQRLPSLGINSIFDPFTNWSPVAEPQHTKEDTQMIFTPPPLQNMV